MIVPRTTGCGLKRLDHLDQDQIRLLDSYGLFHPIVSSVISDIFKKFDINGNNTIDFKEFKAFLEIIGKQLKDETAFKESVLVKYNSHDIGITLRGFNDWWKAQLLQEGDAKIW